VVLLQFVYWLERGTHRGYRWGAAISVCHGLLGLFCMHARGGFQKLSRRSYAFGDDHHLTIGLCDIFNSGRGKSSRSHYSSMRRPLNHLQIVFLRSWFAPTNKWLFFKVGFEIIRFKILLVAIFGLWYLHNAYFYRHRFLIFSLLYIAFIQHTWNMSRLVQQELVIRSNSKTGFFRMVRNFLPKPWTTRLNYVRLGGGHIATSIKGGSTLALVLVEIQMRGQLWYLLCPAKLMPLQFFLYKSGLLIS